MLRTFWQTSTDVWSLEYSGHAFISVPAGDPARLRDRGRTWRPLIAYHVCRKLKSEVGREDGQNQCADGALNKYSHNSVWSLFGEGRSRPVKTTEVDLTESCFVTDTWRQMFLTEEQIICSTMWLQPPGETLSSVAGITHDEQTDCWRVSLVMHVNVSVFSRENQTIRLWFSIERICRLSENESMTIWTVT